MTKLVALVFMIWSFVVCIAGNADASLVLDASYTATPNTEYFASVSGSFSSIGQTFTSLSSGQLAQVVLYQHHVSSGSEDYTIAVTSTVDGSPVGGSVLAQTTFPNSLLGVGGLVAYDLSAANASLIEGTTYGIVISSTGDGVGFGGSSSGGYDGGALFGNGSGGALGSATNADLFFYVFEEPSSTVAVPEPASIVLVVGGLFAAVVRRRY